MHLTLKFSLNDGTVFRSFHELLLKGIQVDQTLGETVTAEMGTENLTPLQTPKHILC